jgi:hypothetical protein
MPLLDDNRGVDETSTDESSDRWSGFHRDVEGAETVELVAENADEPIQCGGGFIDFLRKS